MKEVYKIIQKKEIIRILLESDADYVIVTRYDEDNNILSNSKDTIHTGVSLINASKTAIFSNTSILGSIDLFSHKIDNIRNISHPIDKNVLFLITAK